MNINLLANICETPGIPGYETRIRKLVLQEIEGLADEIKVDGMGNVIALKKGKQSKSIMCAAHMDEIGFIVTHIDDKGFVRFQPLGGFDPKTLTSQRVIVHGNVDVIGVMGSKPIHIMEPEERSKAPKINDFFIDLGLPKEEVEEKIFVGAPISRQRELIEMGEQVNCKSIDNRVSVYILIETLRRLKEVEIPFDFHAVFSVQEEVGLRGAFVAAYGINPDFGIGLDTTIAYDLPGSRPEQQVTALGEGTAIKVLDGSVISDYRMVRYMKEIAAKHQVKFQLECLPAGGTDTAAIQRMSSKGCVAGAISIPTRHIHSVIEMANKSDIQNSIDLLVHTVSEMDSINLEF